MKYSTYLLVSLVMFSLTAKDVFAVNFIDKTLIYGSIKHDGLDRTFGVYIPKRVADGTSRVPMVMMLHGGGGYAMNAARMTGWSAKAEKEGFIAVYPEGTGKFDKILFTWNAIHCCGYAIKNKIDDVGFINNLIDYLVATYPVDSRKIYVTGLSNGGMMAHVLGAALSQKITAIAPVISGLRGDEPRPKGAVPALIINGALDESVPAAGGMQGKKGSKYDDDTPLKPASFQAEYWAENNRCKQFPDIETIGREPNQTYKWVYKCPAGNDVVRYLVGANGHAWPGGQKGTKMGDEPTRAMNATDIIWDFFKRFSK